jgi:hypothetical protein
MKTKNSSKLLLVAAMVATVSLSCSKEKINPTIVPVTSAMEGSIVDYGLVSPDARSMVAILNAQNVSLFGTGNTDMSPLNSAQIQATLYVNDDGSIPTGEYVYSNSESKSPFTFDSASLSGSSDADPGSSINDQIISGKIYVSKDGDKYFFIIQGDLNQGLTFEASYDGSMKYTDITVK